MELADIIYGAVGVAVLECLGRRLFGWGAPAEDEEEPAGHSSEEADCDGPDWDDDGAAVALAEEAAEIEIPSVRLPFKLEDPIAMKQFAAFLRAESAAAVQAGETYDCDDVGLDSALARAVGVARASATALSACNSGGRLFLSLADTLEQAARAAENDIGDTDCNTSALYKISGVLGGVAATLTTPVMTGIPELPEAAVAVEGGDVEWRGVAGRTFTDGGATYVRVVGLSKDAAARVGAEETPEAAFQRLVDGYVAAPAAA
jgi:hypothetical protein